MSIPVDLTPTRIVNTFSLRDGDAIWDIAVYLDGRIVCRGGERWGERRPVKCPSTEHPWQCPPARTIDRTQALLRIFRYLDSVDASWRAGRAEGSISSTLTSFAYEAAARLLTTEGVRNAELQARWRSLTRPFITVSLDQVFNERTSRDTTDMRAPSLPPPLPPLRPSLSSTADTEWLQWFQMQATTVGDVTVRVTPERPSGDAVLTVVWTERKMILEVFRDGRFWCRESGSGRLCTERRKDGACLHTEALAPLLVELISIELAARERRAAALAVELASARKPRFNEAMLGAPEPIRAPERRPEPLVGF